MFFIVDLPSVNRAQETLLALPGQGQRKASDGGFGVTALSSLNINLAAPVIGVYTTSTTSKL